MTDAIKKTAGGDASLDFEAGTYIFVRNTISSSYGRLSLTLTANDGVISISNDIILNGGDLSMNSPGSIASSGIISTNGTGYISIIVNNGDINLSGPISVQDGDIQITNQAMSKSLNIWGGITAVGIGNVSLENDEGTVNVNGAIRLSGGNLSIYTGDNTNVNAAIYTAGSGYVSLITDHGNCSPTPGLNRPEIPRHGQSASLPDLLVA